MKKFFKRLSYSIGNEDWRTEEKALNLQPDDHVLCITASGDRPLNLLKNKCQKLVCIDANPIQNYLLKLKIAAMQNLDYQEYLGFLGAIECNQRLVLFDKILPHLDAEVASYWNSHRRMINKGILYQGEVERLTKVTAAIANLIQGKKIKTLFSFSTIEDQRRFVEKEWNGFFWRKIFQLVLNPFLSRFLIEDPGLMNVGQSINPGTYIFERINASLHRDLAKNNLLLSLILRGKATSEAFSLYLTKLGTQMIKPNLKAIEIQTQDILSYIESFKEPTFDAFSLSDVASYLSYSDFVRLLKAIVLTAKPNARFCLREFLTSHKIPQELEPFFKRNSILEKELEEQDNCFVYRFMVGTVNPSVVNHSQFANVLSNEQLVEV